MNTENRYVVTASLYMLREINRRQTRVNRGYQLLRRKAEALRYKGRQVTSELATTQAILGHTLKEAYISLAAIKFTNGDSNALVLENVGQAQIRVQRVTENISGVTTITLHAVEDSNAHDNLQYAGLGAGGHRTGEAKRLFRDALMILVKFASFRNMCLLLDAAIKSTLRKVNGIEKVIMPKLKNTEKYIITEIDEREREEFHRLKMVKAKKLKAQALANARRNLEHQQELQTAQTSSSGEPCCDVVNIWTSQVRSQDCVISMLSPRSMNFSSTSGSVGDCKPAVSCPHHWEDDDLLF